MNLRTSAVIRPLGALGVLWCVLLSACGGDAKTQSSTHGGAPVALNAADAQALVARRERLANAAGGPDGRNYAITANVASGTLSGVVTSSSAPPDTTVVPTHDLIACKPFTQPAYPARANGVGEAVVWLSGVSTGRADDAPRRATLMLHNCQLEPRVQRVAAGGTILVNSRDAMTSRLRFTDLGALNGLRATVLLNDAGQVVPTGDATFTPGIVAVRDDLHPWVRAYLAVTPHPFVAITEADGAFRFERVPPGSYTLVVWHERFGTHTRPVNVRAGSEANMPVQLR